MIFGSCGKCGASNLPVRKDKLVAHMSGGRKVKPCDWAIPSNQREGLQAPFVNNPHLSFFDNMALMLDLLGETHYVRTKSRQFSGSCDTGVSGSRFLDDSR